MKKIISLFKRNYDSDYLVRDEVVPGAEWVLNGEGTPMFKMDGTCCLIKDGKLFRRYELKHGKNPPDGFVACQDPDKVTGSIPGWVPVGDGPEDRWHREAWDNCIETTNKDSLCPSIESLSVTVELCGPNINGNPHKSDIHRFYSHKAYTKKLLPPYNFENIKKYMAELNPALAEGIVWHHPDGRMVKIKRKDFFKK